MHAYNGSHFEIKDKLLQAGFASNDECTRKGALQPPLGEARCHDPGEDYKGYKEIQRSKAQPAIVAGQRCNHWSIQCSYWICSPFPPPSSCTHQLWHRKCLWRTLDKELSQLFLTINCRKWWFSKWKFKTRCCSGLGWFTVRNFRATASFSELLLRESGEKRNWAPGIVVWSWQICKLEASSGSGPSCHQRVVAAPLMGYPYHCLSLDVIMSQSARKELAGTVQWKVKVQSLMYPKGLFHRRNQASNPGLLCKDSFWER